MFYLVSLILLSLLPPVPNDLQTLQILKKTKHFSGTNGGTPRTRRTFARCCIIIVSLLFSSPLILAHCSIQLDTLLRALCLISLQMHIISHEPTLRVYPAFDACLGKAGIVVSIYGLVLLFISESPGSYLQAKK